MLIRHVEEVGDKGQIAEWARRQHGAFSGVQALQAGFRDKAVQYRLRSGEWIALASGVYSLASAPPTWERQMVAAILSRPRAIASGTSAAYLHDFQGFGPGRPAIMVPWSASGRSTIATVTRSVWFATLPRVTIKGIETMSAAETVLSLAAELPAWRIVRIFEDGLAAGRFVVEDFDEIFERVEGGRVRGIRIIRKLAAVHSADAPEKGASYLERLLEMLLAEPVVPRAVREFPFRLRSRDARVDAYIPDWEIVVEADGRNEHTRRKAWETDRERDNELAARGILVMRFTYRKLKYERDMCLRNLVEAGRHRS